MIKKLLSIISYVIAILFIVFYAFMELMPRLSMSEIARLFLLCGSCLFLFIGGILWSKYKNNNKAMKINLWIFFALYLVLLITLTLFDPMWGRNGFNIFNWNSERFNTYINNSFNIIPFKTIIGYIKNLFSSSLLDPYTVFINVLGNVVCLMPLALFVPLLFKKTDKTWKFIVTILGVTFGIELIQFVTFTGICDIDDIILNTLGALIMYIILTIKDVNNLIKNIFLLEKNKINIKKVIIVVIPIIIVGILIKQVEIFIIKT